MIGHFVAVPVELAFRTACELMAPKKYAPVACNVGAILVHEGVEHLADQLIISFGINKISFHEHKHHTYIPMASGILFGIGAEVLVDGNMPTTAFVGLVGNVIGAEVGEFCENTYFVE